MPFNVTTGIYTPPAGAENAATGQVIQSAIWNTVFTDIAAAVNSLGRNFGGTFSSLPSSPSTGMVRVVTDANVNSWGTPVTSGGGGDTVLVWFNGSNWKVFAQ